MSETPSLGLPLLVAEQAQKHVTHNEALAALAAIVQLAVLDRDQATPPGAPDEGDRYLIAGSPTGAWSGQAGRIADWANGAWSFHAPRAGWVAWIADEARLALFDGADWLVLDALVGSLQELSLGIGTTADSANPFAAKLNSALWTARTVSEGGDGDVRVTLNKEAAADVASLLLQRGFSGRAEIGLAGDDDLTFKVSPDGAAWTAMLILDRSGAKAALGAPLALKAYTVAGLPSAATAGAGASIFVPGETGGAVPAFSDGTNWRRVTDRAIVA